MADNRTGLSPADIAKSFRDRCGDGSLEWVYTPMQTWVLLDAADMLDENEKLRELVWDMWNWLAPTAVGSGAPLKGLFDRMRELGVEV